MFKSAPLTSTPSSRIIRYTRLLLVGVLAAAVIGVITLNVIEAQAANGVYDTDGDKLIEINNLEQLNAVRYDPNGDGTPESNADDYNAAFPVSGGQVCNTGCTGYELKRSLDFDSASSYANGGVNSAWVRGAGWTPIGDFKATFDGNDNTITGLYINRPNASRVGLFSSTSGKVHDLGVLDVEVKGISGGGLAGHNQGAITASHATGSVTATGSGKFGAGAPGGLVGMNQGAITASYAEVSVTGKIDAGGLVGWSDGTITDSYSTGAVTADVSAGGLAGLNNGTITGSYASAAVAGNRFVGGLVGHNESTATGSGTVTRSYSTGSVTGTGDGIGGLVGFNNGGTISGSYSTGNVTGTGYAIGGLVGHHIGGTISLSYSTATVSGKDKVGGLVGSSLALSTISLSYATGSVTGTGERIGGLVGHGDPVISGSFATGNVSGDKYVGGLVGAIGSGGSFAASIQSSYATGEVSGNHSVGGLIGLGGCCGQWFTTVSGSYALGTVSGSLQVGGFVGDGNGQSHTAASNSYWNTDTIFKGVGDDTDVKVTGKTTAELKAPTSRSGIYAEWDTDRWDFGTSSQYPALKADMDGDGQATAYEFGRQGRTPPLGVSVSSSSTAPVRIGTAIPVAVVFTKAVTGFTVEDVTVAKGTAGNFSGSGAAYTFGVTPNAIGRVAVDIAADTAMDADGNGNTAAVRLVLGIPYDDNHNGVIELSELFTAIDDYFEGGLALSHLFALIDLYFGQSGS